MGDWRLQTHLLWWIPKSIFQCYFAGVSSFSGSCTCQPRQWIFLDAVLVHPRVNAHVH